MNNVATANVFIIHHLLLLMLTFLKIQILIFNTMCADHKYLVVVTYRIAQNGGREIVGAMNVICQYFTPAEFQIHLIS